MFILQTRHIQIKKSYSKIVDTFLHTFYIYDYEYSFHNLFLYNYINFNFSHQR